MATPLQIIAAKLSSLKKATAAASDPPAGIPPVAIQKATNANHQQKLLPAGPEEPPFVDDGGVPHGFASDPDDTTWTPAFSKQVWDHWKKSDPDFYGMMLHMAAAELAGKGILKKSPDGQLFTPSGSPLNMQNDGIVAMLKHWAAHNLDPEFYHTELGLPEPKKQVDGAVSADGKFWLAPLGDGDPSDAAGSEAPAAVGGGIRNPTSERTTPPPYRKPGENVREYLARLRELQQNEPSSRHDVAFLVNELESGLADALKSGAIGPPGEGPDIPARMRRWTVWADTPDDTQFTKWEEARDALISRGVLRRDDEAVLGPDGTVFEDGEGLYERRKFESLAAQHLDSDFFGGDDGSLRSAATQDYIDYLAAHGVDQRTLDSIQSGDLQMDPQSRADRALAMGLDPKAVWFRWDSPLKREFKGWTGAALSKPEFDRAKKKSLTKFIDLSPSKEGLVYTSQNPVYAKLGVQVPRGEVSLYPLIGPDSGIAGIDRLPPSAYDAFRAKQATALQKKKPDSPEAQRQFMREAPLAEHLSPPGDLEDWHNWREHGLHRLQKVSPETNTDARKFSTIPDFVTAETRKTYLEPLMAAGAKGTLVRDETGLATAFTPAGARQLRRADLAPLDIRFKNSRNILQSLLAPAAVAAGVASQPPGVLDGLRDE